MAGRNSFTETQIERMTKKYIASVTDLYKSLNYAEKSRLKFEKAKYEFESDHKAYLRACDNRESLERELRLKGYGNYIDFSAIDRSIMNKYRG